MITSINQFLHLGNERESQPPNLSKMHKLLRLPKRFGELRCVPPSVPASQPAADQMHMNEGPNVICATVRLHGTPHFKIVDWENFEGARKASIVFLFR
jgi:hypothetical protein